MAGTASELEYRLMVTDLSTIWIGVATREEVADQINSRSSRVRVPVPITSSGSWYAGSSGAIPSLPISTKRESNVC